MHRDRVRIEIFEGRRGKFEGRVVEVLERGTHTFVGVVHQAGKGQWLVPRDDRLPDRIRVEGEGATHGDLVAAELISWPGRGGQ